MLNSTSYHVEYHYQVHREWALATQGPLSSSSFFVLLLQAICQKIQSKGTGDEIEYVCEALSESGAGSWGTIA